MPGPALDELIALMRENTVEIRGMREAMTDFHGDLRETMGKRDSDARERDQLAANVRGLEERLRKVENEKLAAEVHAEERKSAEQRLQKLENRVSWFMGIAAIGGPLLMFAITKFVH